MIEAASYQKQSPDRDRELIRIDGAHEKMGIAAALRLAFTAAGQDGSEHDFDRLLSDLH